MKLRQFSEFLVEFLEIRTFIIFSRTRTPPPGRFESYSASEIYVLFVTRLISSGSTCLAPNKWKEEKLEARKEYPMIERVPNIIGRPREAKFL